MFRLHKGYLIITIILFIVEVLIALFLHDKFIRPYVGDFLVVILIYCFCKSFLNVRVLPLAVSVLLFSYLVEALQHFKIVDRIGLGNSKLAQVVLGTSFEWTDMLAYTLGIAVIIAVENYRRPTIQSIKA